MSEGVRCFFAIDLPEPVRAEIARVRAAMEAEVGRDVRWVPDENIHLTLKFLGEVPSDQLPKLMARGASRLGSLEPFTAALAGTGAFPSGRAARVLWIGIGEGAGTLAKLARKLESASRGVGAPRERRPYRAHLTLGRLREPRALPIERFPSPDPLSFSVDEVVLYESRLSSSGATYAPLARLPLGADAAANLEFAPEP